ncbi:unnamed protein product [Amaranthus hypochondriacus]
MAWMSFRPKNCRGKVWKLILGCVIWSIWYERNKIKFENKVWDVTLFLHNMKIRLHIWAKELLGIELPMSPFPSSDTVAVV